MVQEGFASMGVYLNGRAACTLYKNETEKPYFVDKTAMLEELFPLVREGNNHICITRPRRFGKTVAANMVAAFFPGLVRRRTCLTAWRSHGRRDMEPTGTGIR